MKIKEINLETLEEIDITLPIQKDDKDRDINNLFYLFNIYDTKSYQEKYASTKTRADVAGGGAKPYKQKGTGRARRGTRSTPLTRGGGVINGPKPRVVTRKTNKKAIRLMIDKMFEGKAKDIFALNTANADLKTKSFVNLITKKNLTNKKIILILSPEDDNLHRVARNIRQVKINLSNEICISDVLTSEKVMVSTKAISEVFNQGKENG